MVPSHGRALAWALLLAASLAAAGLAGEGTGHNPLVYEIVGGDGDWLSYYLVLVGDVDKDGVRDFAASREIGNIEVGFPGGVDLFSGKDGKVLRSWLGDTKFGRLGHEGLLALPDIDRDGVLELAMQVQNEGLRIVSPVTGELWRKQPFEKKEYGEVDRYVLIHTDLDGDGVEEYLASAAETRVVRWLENSGRTYCRSGVTGEVLWAKWGTRRDGQFGFPLVHVGDYDGDGVQDVMTREWIEPWSVQVGPERQTVLLVFSGRTGETLRTHSAPSIDHFAFGHGIVPLGDRDRDGFAEVAVSAPYYRPQNVIGNPEFPNYRPAPGWVGIYRLPEFTLLSSQTGRNAGLIGGPGDQLGIGLGPAGDADGDGSPDLLVGTHRLENDDGSNYAWLYLWSGATGETLATYELRQNFELAIEKIRPLGDVDGDGRDEFLAASSSYRTSTGVIRALRYEPRAARFIRGDADGDGRVSVADVLEILRQSPGEGEHLCPRSEPWLGAPPLCPAAYDIDGDYCVSRNDAVILLYHLFRSRKPPPPPYPDCARYFRVPDPRDGYYPLACEERGACGPGE